MPKPFHELTIDQFADLLSQFPFTRRIVAVHMHHTWRPNHADFATRPPIKTIEGMYNFHTQTNGWSDIAQHVTIDPRGVIWTGRDWNRAPASATGFNGNSAAGPFMFETIGDFDTGRETLEGAQKEAVLAVIALVMKRFDLTPESLRFHNQMSTKTCPGSAVDYQQTVREVRDKIEELSRTRAVVTEGAGFPAEFTALRSRSLSILSAIESAPGAGRDVDSSVESGEPAEAGMNADEVAVILGEPAAAIRGTRAARGGDFTPEEMGILRKHVINLRMGAFSDTGKFTTSQSDVERIFDELLPDELDARQARGEPLRLVFYAHGGLVSEEDGIRPVLRRLPFWRQNGMYPIFFAWETGLKETLLDILRGIAAGQRGLADAVSGLTDPIIEAVASQAGREVWGNMKRSAELSSLPTGGALFVAEKTRDFWNSHHAHMEIHALGHSAGSIFHAYFLPTLLAQRAANQVPPITVEGLHFLAPASTTALFKQKLKPQIGPGQRIKALTMYTMRKEFELADHAGPYRKSLLYLVSRSFEPVRPTPILGLEESLRDDPELIRFFGLSRTIPGVAPILFSKTTDDAPLDGATISTTHGDFDNEARTMNSVARRILRRPAGEIVGFVDEVGQSEVSRKLKDSAIPPVQQPVVAAVAPSIAATPASSGRRLGLCIGINAYPPPNALHGCVSDALGWSRFLTQRGFTVNQLLDAAASRDAILAAFRDLVREARRGDVIAIQYSGHGTTVTDVDGDEESGTDQAICPVDFSGGGLVIDDDIREIFAGIRDGVCFTCFFDCCHSGTNTRLLAPNPEKLAGSLPRYIPREQIDDQHIAFRRALRAPAPPPRVATVMREVSFAACRSDEVAYESGGAGDFTTKALAILGGADGLTNKLFQERLVTAFGAGARQHPILDCGPQSGTLVLLRALA